MATQLERENRVLKERLNSAETSLELVRSQFEQELERSKMYKSQNNDLKLLLKNILLKCCGNEYALIINQLPDGWMENSAAVAGFIIDTIDARETVWHDRILSMVREMEEMRRTGMHQHDTDNMKREKEEKPTVELNDLFKSSIQPEHAAYSRQEEPSDSQQTSESPVAKKAAKSKKTEKRQGRLNLDHLAGTAPSSMPAEPGPEEQKVSTFTNNEPKEIVETILFIGSTGEYRLTHIYKMLRHAIGELSQFKLRSSLNELVRRGLLSLRENELRFNLAQDTPCYLLTQRGMEFYTTCKMQESGLRTEPVESRYFEALRKQEDIIAEHQKEVLELVNYISLLGHEITSFKDTPVSRQIIYETKGVLKEAEYFYTTFYESQYKLRLSELIARISKYILVFPNQEMLVDVKRLIDDLLMQYYGANDATMAFKKYERVGGKIVMIALSDLKSQVEQKTFFF